MRDLGYGGGGLFCLTKWPGEYQSAKSFARHIYAPVEAVVVCGRAVLRRVEGVAAPPAFSHASAGSRGFIVFISSYTEREPRPFATMGYKQKRGHTHFAFPITPIIPHVHVACAIVRRKHFHDIVGAAPFRPGSSGGSIRRAHLP